MMNKTITQILIVLFAVSVAGALYLSNKNEQQRAHLIAKTVLLKQQDDSLVKLNLELDQNKKHVALYNDTLIDLIDKLSAENRRLAFAYSRISNTAPDVQKISQKSVLVVGRAQHSKYMVTLHSVLADDKVSHAILNTLKKKGFGVIEGVNRKIRQPWMARSSTILYYSFKNIRVINGKNNYITLFI